MKVLIAAAIYPPDPGGPATHAKRHFEEFPKLGLETELLALAHYRKYRGVVRHLLYFLHLLPKAWRSDVVYAYDAVGAGLPAWLAARICGKKFVVRIGGDVAWERAGEKSNTSLKEWYESGGHEQDKMFKVSRFVLQRADAVVVTTPILADLYVQRYGVARDKIKVILNPVPTQQVATSKADQTIVFASRLASYKNLDAVLQALAPIFQTHKDLKLVIMGDGPERENLRDIVHNLDIEDRVEFVGSVSQEEVVRRTSACLFTIAPALTEFNPNYVLQGISMGKPFVISWENGFSFEVPEHMRFNPRSIEDCGKKILGMLDDEIYQKAQDYVKSLGLSQSWESNLKENVEVIEQVLNGSK